ncbi:hypothetical protein HKD28_14340 [Gluconobacter sp. LMG 1744]|uniref:hypothetical protein n=1 Tax=Gluconobacter TaxID=441 RepID=UPI001884934D|nr:hypothetical protein [Gluconobacter cadivus]MBF0892576.1 hypothetical protein [Gluconobacter cadivus]
MTADLATTAVRRAIALRQRPLGCIHAATDLPEWAEICEGKKAIEMYVNNYNLDTAQSKSLQITIHSVS